MSRSMRRLLVALALLALAGGLWWTRGAPHRPPAPARPAASGVARAPAIRSAIGFRTRELLAEHYRKHGREFGDISMGEYLRLAQELRDRLAGGDVLEQARDDGVITRFDRRSGAFIAFDPDRTIRTFFRPTQGETYFRRQLTRRHSGGT